MQTRQTQQYMSRIEQQFVCIAKPCCSFVLEAAAPLSHPTLLQWVAYRIGNWVSSLC